MHACMQTLGMRVYICTLLHTAASYKPQNSPDPSNPHPRSISTSSDAVLSHPLSRHHHRHHHHRRRPPSPSRAQEPQEVRAHVTSEGLFRDLVRVSNLVVVRGDVAHASAGGGGVPGKRILAATAGVHVAPPQAPEGG